jgi:hypothetical protein
MTVTQASLSPDLDGALGAAPVSRDTDMPQGAVSEGALWVVALLSSGLVLAAVLLLGLLARNAITDASFGGFISGIAVMVAALGVGGQTYALVTARRQGLLPTPTKVSATAASSVPSGMHVVPARPADLGRRRREQLEAAHSERSKQAKAIAAAVASSTIPRPAQRPATPRPAAPRPSQPPVPAARTQPNPPPAIRMPATTVWVPRPAAWPTAAPVLRMSAPQTHPQAQAALFQVNATNVRPPAPGYRR